MAGDYSTSGGALKLKGGSSVTKKPKKRKSKPTDESKDSTKPSTTTSATTAEDRSSSSLQKTLAEADSHDSQEVTLSKDEERLIREERSTKTEAERRHEAQRRKRLEERLKREGVKTHKERVEELNKYLSGLSEHHDMPRIGPG